MSGFLVDTNVISEILKPSPDLNVRTWSLQADRGGLFLSVVSLGELRKGIAILPPSARRRELEESSLASGGLVVAYARDIEAQSRARSCLGVESAVGEKRQ